MSNFLINIYKEIASSYELTNRLFSFGLDMRWRKKAIKEIPTQKNAKWIDVCTGTGEFVVSLKKIADPSTEVYGLDFSEEMLEIAKNKKAAKHIKFIKSSAYELPFPENTFDLVTISFAMRNLKTGIKEFSLLLSEIQRVLKPGGMFLNLETSQPELPLINILFRFYVKLMIPTIGSLFSKKTAGYKYLANSTINFFTAEALSEQLEKAGFVDVTSKKLFMGAIAIHKAKKISK